MKLQDFRIGWRTLVQEPAYSLVVILGLGVGLAASLLLFGFVQYSWQYNASVPDVDNVYIVKHRSNTDPRGPSYELAPLFLRPVAQATQGVAVAAAFLPSRPNETGFTVSIDGKLSQLVSVTATPGFAGLLGLQAVHGNLDAALDNPDTIVVTEDAAVRLFGAPDAVGRRVQVEGKLARVGAVIRTPAANTTIPFEMLLGVNSVLIDKNVRDELNTGKEGWPAKLLIRVHPGASLADITASLQQAVDNSPHTQKLPPEIKQRLGQRKVIDIALSPLRDAYFDVNVEGNFIAATGERANRVVVAGLGVIAALILALAAINYVNLAAVRVLRRQREIAMRKVLGASMRQVVLQLLAESMLVALVATGLGLLLAWLALPMFSELVNRDLSGILAPANIAAALGLGVLLGVVTAIWPAWIAVHVRPSEALAGRAGTESRRGMQLRRAMTVLQVATAMGFASVTLAVAWQTEFAMKAHPGFDPGPMLVIDLPFDALNSQDVARNMLTAFAAHPAIAGYAVSEDAVGRKNGIYHRELKRPEGGASSTEMKWVSPGFFEHYRIKPEAGRLFNSSIDKEDDPVPLVINAIAARELGYATPSAAVGQTLTYSSGEGKPVHKRVVGIAPEVRFYSLREKPRAMGYELSTASTILSIRAARTVEAAERAVREIWPKYFPDAMLKMHHAADVLALNYAEDARMAKLLAVATCIALAIAAFGTYVLASHTVQRRGREIVMRKLHGARRRDIGKLVVREIGALTLVSALIALPLAAIAIERYLATFVEHAPIGYWTMAFALGSTLVVAMLAVARQAWIAMRMVPADALRV